MKNRLVHTEKSLLCGKQAQSAAYFCSTLENLARKKKRVDSKNHVLGVHSAMDSQVRLSGLLGYNQISVSMSFVSANVLGPKKNELFIGIRRKTGSPPPKSAQNIHESAFY